MKQKPTISIVGLRYVGLCTVLTFAKKGFRTIGVEIDRRKVETTTEGQAPFHEPRLNSMLKDAIRTRRLSVTHLIAESAQYLDDFRSSRDPVKARWLH